MIVYLEQGIPKRGTMREKIKEIMGNMHYEIQSILPISIECSIRVEVNKFVCQSVSNVINSSVEANIRKITH